MSRTSGFQAVFEGIQADIRSAAPLTLLTGAAGSGKTTLLNALADDEDLASRCLVLCVQDAAGRREDLIETIGRELEAAAGHQNEGDDAPDIATVMRDVAESDRFPVIMIDDFRETSIETARTLLDVAIHSVPLALVLAGPDRLHQLVDRIHVRGANIWLPHKFRLRPLSNAEAKTYVSDRLEHAGGKANLFTSDAIERINRAALGVPARINEICHGCLVLAFSERRPVVDDDIAARFLKAPTDASGMKLFRSVEQARVRNASGPSGLNTIIDGRSDALVQPARPAARHAPPPTYVPPLPRPDPITTPPEENASTSRFHYVPPPPEAEDPVEPRTDPTRTDSDPDDRPSGRARLWTGGAAAAAVTAAVIWSVLPDAQAPQPLETGSIELVRGEEAERQVEETSPVETTASESVLPTGPPLSEMPATSGADGEAFYQAGLASDTARESAIHFSRAAIRNHQRSAAFLGQMYETGDGVSFAPGVGARWNAVADGDSPDGLGTDAIGTITPVFAAIEDGGIDLVWDGTGDSFVLELADENQQSLGVFETVLTAARLADPGGSALWRVSTADGTVTSDWAPIETAQSLR